MVKLEEVEDEAFTSTGADEADWDTDSASDVSSIDEAVDESIYDRLLALKDVVPPAQRRKIAATVSSAQEWGWWGLSGVARTTWLVGVSVMLIGIPFAVGYSEEQMILMEEQQQKMQQSANDVLAPSMQNPVQGDAKAEAL